MPPTSPGWLIINEPGGLTDQSHRIHYPTGMKFSCMMRKRGSMSCGLYIPAGDNYLPTVGSPVYCWEVTASSANQVFAGTIDDYTLTWMGNRGDQIAAINVVTLEQCFDTIEVPGSLYTNKTAGYIFHDLVTRWAAAAPVQFSYGVSGASIQAGKTLDKFICSGWPKLSDMFDQLAKLSQFNPTDVLSGYAWGVNMATSPPMLYFQPATFSSPWQSLTVYALGSTIVDTAGHLQLVTTAGTSGATQPTFSHVGGTTSDGSVVWTDQGGGYQQPVPFEIESGDVQWESFDLNLSRKDYRNRQVIQLSFDAFAHSSELFAASDEHSISPYGPNSFQLMRPVEQVTNAWYTFNTQNKATGTFTGQPTAGDTISFNFPSSGSIYNWMPHVGSSYPSYSAGQIIIDSNGHVQKVTAPGSGVGYTGTSEPVWSTDGGFVTDGPPAGAPSAVGLTWTDQGPQGFSATYQAVYEFVATLDNRQVGQVLIGSTSAITWRNLVDAINALDQTNTAAGGSTTRGRGVTFSWPTWENPLVNADAISGSTFVVRNKAAGQGYVVALTKSCSAFSWGSPGIAQPDGSVRTAGGVTTFGTSIAAVGEAGTLSQPGLVYTPGSPVVSLSTPLGLPPNVGLLLQVEYTRQDGDAIIVEDTAQVIARAAIEHGTGKYQQSIKDSSATNLQGLIEAQSALASYCVIPSQFTLSTLRPGIYPGLVASVKMLDPTGISALIDGLWLVQEVSADLIPANPWMQNPFDGVALGHYRYKVKLVDVAQIGDYITFWEGIASGSGGGGGGETVLGAGSYGAQTPAPTGLGQVTVTSTPYLVLDTDVVVTLASGSGTVNLPNGASITRNLLFFVNRSGGNITIVPASGDTINGGGSLTLTDGSEFQLVPHS